VFSVRDLIELGTASNMLDFWNGVGEGGKRNGENRGDMWEGDGVSRSLCIFIPLVVSGVLVGDLKP